MIKYMPGDCHWERWGTSLFLTRGKGRGRLLLGEVIRCLDGTYGASTEDERSSFSWPTENEAKAWLVGASHLGYSNVSNWERGLG